MNACKELIDLSIRTHKIDLNRAYEEHLNMKWYMQQIINETNESINEIKPNNIPYLEDELGDVLWAWFMAVENLKD